jgi:HlyD family secretion protein
MNVPSPKETDMSDSRTRPQVLDSDAPEGSSGLPLGRIVAALIVAGLVVWTVTRVRSAQSEQARLLAERTEAAEVAKKERKDKPLVLRSGVSATWKPLVHVEGTLHASEEADLSFKVPGRLSSIRAKVGDVVRRGQTLAALEQTESAAAVEQARAQLRASEAQLALAQDSATRTKSLVASGAGSQQAALQTEQQHALAAAQADAARAAVSLAQANLGNATLLAPFAGVVTKVPSGVGQVVNPGAVLFHVQNTTELKLVGTVSEAEASLVHVGAPVKVLGPDGAVTGQITAVLGAVDPTTRRVPIEARVPNDRKSPLLGGSYVRAEVEGKDALPVLRLPAGVIRPGSQNEVMVADKGRLVARTVIFHPAADGMILVRAGLDAHDQVVVDPSPEAKEGDRVPVDATAGTPATLSAPAAGSR